MGMMMTGRWRITAALLLAGCVNGVAPAPKTIPVLHMPAGKSPPDTAETCWASDTTPAVIETVTDHLLIRSEQRDDLGNITRPAEFETKTAQRLLQDRERVWFEAPCRADMTIAFIASLQRALKARGRYFHPITGVYDQETGEAVRKLQADRGLDSPILSRMTALDLGLVRQGANGP